MKTRLIRNFAFLAGATGMVLALSAGSAVAGQFDGVTLRIGTFGGSWKDRLCSVFCPKFEAEGGKVEWVAGNPRILFSKMVAARGQEPPVDVIEIVDSTYQETLKAGFIQKYDPKNVPNTKNLGSSMYNEYIVANWVTEEGFLIDLEKFKELGIPRPTRWKDLLNPKLKGRVALPDINNAVSINTIVGFASEEGGDERNIDPGLDLIKKLDVHSFWSSGTQITQMFNAGDIWACAAHAGWGVRLHDAGVKVGFVHPEVKGKRGMTSAGYAAVTSGTKNKAAAEFYINILVSDEMQELLHVKNGIVPPNQNIQSKYADKAKLDASGVPFLMMNPEQIANVYLIDYAEVDLKAWTKKWNRKVAR